MSADKDHMEVGGQSDPEEISGEVIGFKGLLNNEGFLWAHDKALSGLFDEKVVDIKSINWQKQLNERIYELFKEFETPFAEVVNQVLGSGLSLAERKAVLYQFSRAALDAAQSMVPPVPPSMPESSFYLEANFENKEESHPYNWLGKHYGQWLQHFSPSLDRDYIFQHELKALDSALYNALRSRRKGVVSLAGVSDLSEIISPRENASIAKVEHLSASEQQGLYLALTTNKLNPKT